MGIDQKIRMDSDSFIAWAMEQPEGEHYELHDGEVVRMPAERVLHARTKLRILIQLNAAVAAKAPGHETFGDGMAVEVNSGTVFEPDVMVYSGPKLDGAVVKITTPVIVVEVLSPSTRGADQTTKLAGYLRIASLRHYLIIDPANRRVVHHRRAEDGSVSVLICGSEPITLDPPGIVLAGIFPE